MSQAARIVAAWLGKHTPAYIAHVEKLPLEEVERIIAKASSISKFGGKP